MHFDSKRKCKCLIFFLFFAHVFFTISFIWNIFFFATVHLLQQISNEYDNFFFLFTRKKTKFKCGHFQSALHKYYIILHIILEYQRNIYIWIDIYSTFWIRASNYFYVILSHMHWNIGSPYTFTLTCCKRTRKD